MAHAVFRALDCQGEKGWDKLGSREGLTEKDADSSTTCEFGRILFLVR